jgi:hypothetical protein
MSLQAIPRVLEEFGEEDLTPDARSEARRSTTGPVAKIPALR